MPAANGFAARQPGPTTEVPIWEVLYRQNLPDEDLGLRTAGLDDSPKCSAALEADQCRQVLRHWTLAPASPRRSRVGQSLAANQAQPVRKLSGNSRRALKFPPATSTRVVVHWEQILE